LKHNKVIRKLILALALLLPTFVATAQVNISSPYSIFGIGNLYGISSQMNMALGGAATAFSSPYYINPANPASYMAFDTNSFVFDAAFTLRSATLQTIDQSQKTRFGTLSNLYFGFPVTKWWRASMGIMPYSNVGYEMQGDQIVTHIGQVVSIYKGSGGLNKAYIGSAFSPVKNLSVGFNMSYIFGNIVKERAMTFPDSGYFLNTMARSSARLNKVNFDAGLIYRKTMKEGRFFQVGLTYRPTQTVDGQSEKIVYTYAYNYAKLLEEVKDTVSFDSGSNGEVILPASIGAGFMLGSTNRWFATADVNYQKWSEFRYLGNNPGMKDNLRISLGGQFRPSAVDIGKYYERINYRAGFRFEQSYLEIQNTRINDIGISFGVGLPMKKSRSTINIAVELGTQGTTDNGLIKENYMRLTIGSALQERWFLKRRFN
jgi:long-subunit fatty acid transport protein